MNSPGGTSTSSEPSGAPAQLDTEVLVGCCYGVVTVPARQLPDFYQGYAWMARVALLFAILFCLALGAIEVFL